MEKEKTKDWKRVVFLRHRKCSGILLFGNNPPSITSIICENTRDDCKWGNTGSNRKSDLWNVYLVTGSSIIAYSADFYTVGQIFLLENYDNPVFGIR